MNNERALLNLDRLAIDIGVPYTSLVSADGATRYTTEWSVPFMVKAVDEIKKLVAGKGDMNVCGGGPHWLLGAAMAAAHPQLKSYVIIGLPIEAVFYELPLGEPTPEGGIRFTIEHRDGRAFVGFECDDPTKPPLYGPHNYDRNLLPKVVLPAVAPDEDVFIHGTGEYSIVMNIVNCYCGKCRSMSVAGEGVDGYVCVYSDNPKLKIGDITPMEE